MATLEWLLVIELVVLATTFGAVKLSKWIAGDQPKDEISLFYRAFWRNLRRNRRAYRAAAASLDDRARDKLRELYDSKDDNATAAFMRESNLENVDAADVGAILDEIAEAPSEPEPTPHADDNAASTDQAPAPADELLFNVAIAPNESAVGLLGRNGDRLHVAVTCGPEEGQANKLVIDFLADVFDVNAYQVSLVRGHFKAQKVIRVVGLSASTADERLAAIA